jgi:hypothetical protein
MLEYKAMMLGETKNGLQALAQVCCTYAARMLTYAACMLTYAAAHMRDKEGLQALAQVCSRTLQSCTYASRMMTYAARMRDKEGLQALAQMDGLHVCCTYAPRMLHLCGARAGGRGVSYAGRSSCSTRLTCSCSSCSRMLHVCCTYAARMLHVCGARASGRGVARGLHAAAAAAHVAYGLTPS